MTRAEHLEIVRRRLTAQRLAGERMPATPADVVRGALAVQAQEWPDCRWSIGLRTGDAEVDQHAVQAALDSGELVRTHLLRPTWHVVAREDVRWLTRLSAERIDRAARQRHRQLGLDEPTITAALSLFERELAEHGVRTRPQLAAAMTADGQDPSGQRMPHLLMVAELRLLLTGGPAQGKHHGYVLADAQLPPDAERDRDEALAELARRYQPTRAPVTPEDFAWWANITLTEARHALETAAAPGPADGAGVLLLPTYDELFVSYAAGRHAWAAPPPEDSWTLLRTILLDGRAVGLWRRTQTARKLTLEATLLVSRTRRLDHAVEGEAERMARFNGRAELEVRTKGA